MELLELQRTMTRLMPRCMYGATDPAVVPELEGVASRYRALVADGVPANALYTERQVRHGLAHTVQWQAAAAQSLGDGDGARCYLGEAEAMFRAIGDREAADKCAADIARGDLAASGGIDDELARLYATLARRPAGSLARVETLLELGELHSSAGDEFEARRLLHRAAVALDEAGFADASANAVGAALLEFTTQVERGHVLADRPRIELLIHARMLRIRQLHALAQIEADVDPAAAHRLLEELDALRKEPLEQELLTALQDQITDGAETKIRSPEVDVVALAGELTALDAALNQPDPPLRALALRAGMLQAEARRSGSPELLTIAALRRTNVLLRLERRREAIEVLEQAAQTLGSVRQHDLGVRVAAQLAEAYAAEGDWLAVDQTCQAAIEVVERLRHRVSGQNMRESYLRWRISLYTLGARAALALGDPELAVARTELAKSRGATALAARHARGSPRVVAVDAELRALGAQIDAARDADEDAETLLECRRALWDLRAVELSRDQDERPAASLPAIQRAVADDEAILSYFWLDREELLILALDRDHAAVEVRCIPAADRRVLDALISASLAGSTEVSDYAAAGGLPASLMPGDVSALRGKRRIYISPHRHLHALPLHALPLDGAPLIDRSAVVFVPNLAALLAPERPPRGRGVVALGLRNFDHPDRSWRPLDNGPEEARDVEALWREATREARALVEDEATEDRLRELAADGTLSRAAALHFATHGESVQADVPMESFLALRTSILDGLDIAEWQLDADLVVLSACCSGQRAVHGRGLDELPADELSGLQAAFFEAGAACVLGCLWPVESSVARDLTLGVHRGILGGLAPDEALRRAIKDYRATAKLLTGQPYFWAPFFLTAISRPRPLAEANEAL